MSLSTPRCQNKYFLSTTWPELYVNPFVSAIFSGSFGYFVQIWRRCVLKLPWCSSEVRKWNTRLATSTCEITAGMQYRLKWRVFLVHLESWLRSQIQTSKKAETETQLKVEVAHMLMHNHNVQYPNLRDYRKIEQWQGHRSIPIMVALCIISY